MFLALQKVGLPSVQELSPLHSVEPSQHLVTVGTAMDDILASIQAEWN